MAAPPESGRDAEPSSEILHATTIALNGRALIIIGPSGSGKSGLALALMASGADLISDDRTILSRRTEGPPVASAPPAIRGKIEVRGLGLLAADPAPPSPVAAIVDLGTVENDRLPPPRTRWLGGAELPLFHKVESPYFPAALLQYLKGGRCKT